MSGGVADGAAAVPEKGKANAEICEFLDGRPVVSMRTPASIPTGQTMTFVP